ncbi:uncharacterized protein LOC129944893 [Eupeodes corollae]|uniref:uncharacterized protein LOC129944893 n=1 Tax=Eupeodes corollae TaxID=290404 RepID=UPI00249354B4|nr:uncharacterized protein LOC129944893 [Eupeodes corollae]
MKTVQYQEAIGSILYAAQVSRPDLSFAVGALLRFNNNPAKSHWIAVKRLFRYIKGTINDKLEYTRDIEGCFEGFSDADWSMTQMTENQLQVISLNAKEDLFHGMQRNNLLSLSPPQRLSIWP